MRITMIGTGYVGLVSGACFADIGHDVICVDLDERKIQALRDGTIPIYEPGLDAVVARGMQAGRLSFTTDLAPAVASADAVFIAVGTPTRAEDGSADLSYVHAAAAGIAKALRGFTVIVNKSTVPVGTADAVEEIVRRANPRADFAVVSNPEFLREGAALADFQKPDRIVIGVEEDRARSVMDAIYAPIQDAPVLHVGRRTAELTKYAGNAFLAMKITFINEIADLCERTGADVAEVARGIGLDSRIGPMFLQAGPGYGGSCFPKDTRALVQIGKEHDCRQNLVEATVRVNDRRRRAMADKIVRTMGGDVRGRTIAILGLAFKANTDDMRDSPAIGIVKALQEAGARIRAYDPAAMETAKTHLDQVEYASDAYAAARGADAVATVTEWAEFRSLDLVRLGAGMRDRTLVDLRNLFEADVAHAKGFVYASIGRADDEHLFEDAQRAAA